MKRRQLETMFEDQMMEMGTLEDDESLHDCPDDCEDIQGECVMIRGTIFVDATCSGCGKEQRIELDRLPEYWPPHMAVEEIGWTSEWNPCPTGREQRYEHFCRQCWLEKRIADKAAELARMREELQGE